MIIDLDKINLDYEKCCLMSNGYTVLRNVISKEFLRDIENECTSLSWGLINKGEINVIKDQKKCTLSSSHNLAQYSKNIRLIYQNKEIRKFFSHVIGENSDSSKMINSSYFFKAKESKDIKLHQDNAYFNLVSGINCLTFYIPIHSQSKKKGTIFYFRGSHLINMLEHIPEGNLGASMCLKNNKKLKKLRKYYVDYLDLQPGDISVHNALVVHGTLPNPKNKKCEAFNFSLFGENNSTNIEKYDQYKSMLKKFLLKNNN